MWLAVELEARLRSGEGLNPSKVNQGPLPQAPGGGSVSLDYSFMYWGVLEDRTTVMTNFIILVGLRRA